MASPDPEKDIVAIVTLQDEIEHAAADIHTDAYAMSVGEIINLYRDGELVIRPAFQRLFRWSPYQKSRFIESILLGIPIPSVFVSQREDGVWEVVDGLQRLSTILEFVGELKKEDGTLHSPSVLVGTKYLESLDQRTFDSGQAPLASAQRIAFKRAKLDIKIVKEAATATTKYDLFDRLNSGGAKLSDQEFRNSLIVMSDASFLDWLETLRSLPDFQAAVSPSENQLSEQYDLELVIRFLALVNRDVADLRQFKDLRELLTDSATAYAQDPTFDRPAQGDRFARTFAVLGKLPEQRAAFQRYDSANDRFLGKFSVSAFEVVSSGLAHNLNIWEPATPTELRTKIGTVWSDSDFKEYAGGGVPPTTRIPRTVGLGRELFQTVA